MKIMIPRVIIPVKGDFESDFWAKMAKIKIVENDS